jgi:hypothetical protein
LPSGNTDVRTSRVPAEPPPKPVNDPASEPAAPVEAPRRPSQLRALGPERQSLMGVRLLGAIFAVTMVAWGGAKLSCNRTVSPVLQPRPLALAALTKRPKETALELQQRAAGYHFAEALELAKGDAALALESERQRCQAEPARCDARQKQSDAIQTTAVLLTRDPKQARVRAESFIGETRERYLMDLEYDGTSWAVVRRVPDPG